MQQESSLCCKKMFYLKNKNRKFTNLQTNYILSTCVIDNLMLIFFRGHFLFFLESIKIVEESFLIPLEIYLKADIHDKWEDR
jgi:hypothetical protein